MLITHYGEWIIDEEASETSEGQMHRICQDCGHEEFQTINKLENSNNFDLILIIALTSMTAVGLLVILIIVFHKKRKNK